MTGSGGAVASVDAVASQVGIDVLEAGGNATDAAIATAAALGVTEPYSTGIGGGGFFVHRDASTRRGRDHRRPGDGAGDLRRDDVPHDQATGRRCRSTRVVNSGLSVGVPGTPATWERAAQRWGTERLGELLKPAERIALRRLRGRPDLPRPDAANELRFELFPETARVFLPGGEPPAVGSVFRNPDMAKAYRELRTRGIDSLYEGRLGEAVVAEVTDPSTRPDVEVFEGEMTTDDLSAYRALVKAPTHSTYRGMDVYGMPVPSSGGIAVGEILNLIEAYDERTGTPTSEVDDVQYLHRFSEASATAFADRNRYVGDVPGVPTAELLSQGFADERACLFDPTRAQPRPVPFGAPDGAYAECGAAAPPARSPTTTSRRPTSRSSTAGAMRWPTPRRSSRPAVRASPCPAGASSSTTSSPTSTSRR